MELVIDHLDPKVNKKNKYFDILDNMQPFVKEVSCRISLHAN